MRTQRHHLLYFSLLGCLFLLLLVLQTTHAQEPSAGTTDDCSSVRYMMQEMITPADRASSGGFVEPGKAVSRSVEPEFWSDYWLVNVARETNAVGTVLEASLDLVFNEQSNLNLEFALFRGMQRIADSNGVQSYQPVELERRYQYTLPQEGLYTLVVRRTQIVDQSAGSYKFVTDFELRQDVAVTPLRNESGGPAINPLLNDSVGYLELELSGIKINTHAGALQAVASRNGAAAQTFFNTGTNNSFIVNNWASSVRFLGGDVDIRGMSEDGLRRRLYYFENYAPATQMLDGLLNAVVDANGATLRLTWDALVGVWMLDNCAGFRLQDGTTFVARLVNGSRDFAAQGVRENFTIRDFAPGTDGQPAFHIVSLDWRTVKAGSEATLFNSVLTLNIIQNRLLQLEATTINLTYDATQDLITADMPSRNASIILDWTNIQALSLIGDTIAMEFTDGVRDSTTRDNGRNLSLFDAREGVIHIVYQNTSDELPGAERLLLPDTESYLEIYTPAGMPQFNGRALPGEAGYAPRALNNLGGECYPINTLQEIANCPPNGYPNPANGNLWISITDQIAEGGLLDLTLTRSYNSRHNRVNGPFGRGWTTGFLLDYDVAFDEPLDSRVVDTSDPTAIEFPVGLDLTWSPRGIVTYTTASGSQHVFTRASESNNNNDLRAITMPGWKLTRSDLRDPLWTLEQDNGLTLWFDRAGRLSQYGYPTANRIITVEYPAGLYNGAGSLGATPVVITDAAEMRRLELYYNAAHHIERSVLLDLITGEALTTQYTYNGDLLTSVTYPDGLVAAYTYDGQQRLIGHNDPRAPIAPEMTYTYNAQTGFFASATVVTENGPLTWRELSAPPLNGEADTANSRTTTVTDELGNVRTYTYRLSAGTLRQAGEGYTLISHTSPLAGVEAFEDQPITYTWRNGLLTALPVRSINELTGQNSITYTYFNPDNTTATPHLTSIDYDTSVLQVAYDSNAGQPRPLRVTFQDRSSVSYSYSGRMLETFINRFGGEYRYSWSDDLVQSIQQPDRTRIQYSYNAVGLVETMSLFQSPDDLAPYTVTYAYDGLGRLVQVDDPLTGTYTLRYTLPQGANGAYAEITVTDPVGVVTVSRFDAHGNLIETTVQEAESATFLRKTTYAYDVFGRLVEERQWLLPVETLDDVFESEDDGWYTTTYRYENVESLGPLPGQTDRVTIRGYRVTVTGAFGRSEIYVYDALGRVRQTVNRFGRIDRYSYAPIDPEAVDELLATGLPNALQITQEVAQGDRVVRTARYIFDLKGRLRGVQRGDKLWEFFFLNESPTYSLLQSPSNNIGRIQWSEYAGGLPGSVVINPSENVPNLQSNYDVSSQNGQFDTIYDVLGRVIQMTDGNGSTRQVVYCPLPGGGQRVMVAYIADVGQMTPLNCESTTFDSLRETDALGRLTRTADSTGNRTFSYTPLPITHQWQVDAVFTAADGTSTTRQMIYNGVNDLVQYTDENGFVRTYLHDTLGRLRRVDVSENREASYTFTYNKANRVTSALDDLGRGYRYDYNALGQVTVQQDALTADAFIYGYNSNGTLSTVISPLGNTTTYLYEDPNDPTRLTRIIEPTGSQHQFRWVDRARPNAPNAVQLIYTDPRDGETTYGFDSYGLLWRVDDAIGRSYELHYDAMGRLIDWLQPQTNNNAALRRYLQLDYDGYNIMTLSEPQTGWSQSYTFNTAGAVRQVKDANGDSVSFVYDPLGRLTSVDADGRQWQIAYGQGEMLIVDDTYGDSTSLRFDELRRLVSSRQGDAETTYTYKSGSGARVDVFVDDTARRVVSITARDPITQSPTIAVRAPGERMTYVYNPEGVLEELTIESCMNYVPTTDALLPDTCVDQGDVWRLSSRYIYDGQGRLIRYIDSEQGTEILAYDDAGNLVTYQDVKGKTFSYTYDNLNRLSSITGPTGIKLVLGYNTLDLVTGVCQTRAASSDVYTNCEENGLVLEEYVYDSLGRLIEQRFAPDTGEAGRLVYRYDGANLAGWGVQGDSSVLFHYEADGLNRLERMITGGSTYTFKYGVEGLLSDSNISYTYDDWNRVASIQVAGKTLSYSYAQADQGYAITELTDTGSGASLQMLLDEQGFLKVIDYQHPDEQAAEGQAQTTRFEYQLNRDGRRLLVTMHWDNGERVELQFNPQGDVESIVYRDNNLTLDYVNDAAGQLQRSGMAGSASYFVAADQGYVMVIGYDNDDRPLTMRISDRASSALLYQLSFTYDTQGRRIRETRQYQNGMQVLINYAYNDTDRITYRSVEVIPPDAAFPEQSRIVSLPTLIFGLAGVMVVSQTQSRRKRSGVLMFVAVVGVFGVFAMFRVIAQQGLDAEGYHYQYDASGNLVQVDYFDDTGESQTCATFTYDNANRLLSLDINGQTRTYRYDAYNRVVGVDNRRFIYQGDSSVVLASVDQEGTITFYGQSEGYPLVFQGTNENIVWMLSDGRGQVLGALIGEDTQQPLWLYDPLGRFLSLQPNVPDIDDPCRAVAFSPEVGDLPPELASMSLFETFQPDMFWDWRINLYFSDGRVYVPELGQYLQRDPIGPDVFGNLYAYPARQTTPPIVRRQPHYMDGLMVLQQAVSNANITSSLSPDTIRAQYYPDLVFDQMDTLYAQLDVSSQRVFERLEKQLNFPAWLANGYNIPMPSLDAQGALRFQAGIVPGQGGRGTTSYNNISRLLDHESSLLPQTVILPLNRLQSLVELTGRPNRVLTTYQQDAWMAPSVGLSDTWQSPTNRPELEDTPGVIWNWLPRTFIAPQDNAYTLQAIQQLIDMPSRSREMWVEGALQKAMPVGLPDIPKDSEDWLNTLFSYDTLGIVGHLEQRWQPPEQPSIPVYQPGALSEWILGSAQ